MRSSATTPPEFWSTFQHCGPRGGAHFIWQRRAGKAFGLLKPFLHAWPEPLVCQVSCPDCPLIRDITNPYEDVFILERGEDCTRCEPDRTITRDDIRRTGVNGKVLVSALAGALEFFPAPLPEGLWPTHIVDLGTVRLNGVTMPVTLMFPMRSGVVNLDAAFPVQTARVILHMEMEEGLIAALQQRRFITVHLPSVVQPARNGTFKAKQPLAAILAGVPVPAVADESTLAAIDKKLATIPSQTAALMGSAPARKRRHLGEIIEPGFTASSGFKLIHFNGVSYRIPKLPASAISCIYFVMKEHGWDKVPEDEILIEVYGNDRDNWPKNKNARIGKLFRSGDASRLWEAGFIGSDSRGNFFITAKMHT